MPSINCDNCEYELESGCQCDFAALDQAIKEKTDIFIVKKRDDSEERRPGFLHRLLSKLRVFGGNPIENEQDPKFEEEWADDPNLAIACRLCERPVPASLLSKHSALCAQVQKCMMSRAEVDDYLAGIISSLDGQSFKESDGIRWIANRALQTVSSGNSNLVLQQSALTISKLQYKLTKQRTCRTPGYSTQFDINYSRLKYLLERKKDLLEQLADLYEQLGNLNGVKNDSKKTPGKMTLLLNSVLKGSSIGKKACEQQQQQQQHLTNVPNIDDFKILKALSKGAYGSVFLARNKKTDDLYAIKAIKKTASHRKNTVSHALTERKVLSLVRSPWVIGLYFAFQSDSFLFLVMEYAVGGDLGGLLRVYRRFPVTMIRFYAAELVTAVELLHENGIIHHDLKPENVLIAADGHIKLIDLGLAKLQPNQSTPKSTLTPRSMYTDASPLGTPDYMAPEIVKGEPYDRSVDIWALGCILVELATGVPPFNDTTPEAIFGRILARDWHPFPGSIDDCLIDLCEQLLNMDPLKRPSIDDVKDHKFFEGIVWSELREQLTPPFIPRPASEDDTVYFDVGNAGNDVCKRTSLLGDFMDARPVHSSDLQCPVGASPNASPARSVESFMSTSLSGMSSVGSSSSPFESSFNYKSIDLLESVNRRIGQQLRNSGAASPLRRPHPYSNVSND